jgi:hypothetical protein
MAHRDDSSLPDLATGSDSDADVLNILQRLARSPAVAADAPSEEDADDSDDSSSSVELTPLEALRAALKGAVAFAAVKEELDSRFAFVTRLVGDSGIRWRVKCAELGILTQEFATQAAAEAWLLGSVRRTEGLTEADVLRRRATGEVASPVVSPAPAAEEIDGSDSDGPAQARGRRPSRGAPWTPGASKYLCVYPEQREKMPWTVRSQALGARESFCTLAEAETFFEKLISEKGKDIADYVRVGFTPGPATVAPSKRGAVRGRTERDVVEAEPVAKRRAVLQRQTSPIIDSPQTVPDRGLGAVRQRAVVARDAAAASSAGASAALSSIPRPAAPPAAEVVDGRRLLLESLANLLREKVITFQEYLEGSSKLAAP